MQCLVFQLCLTLCDPMDCSWPRSSVHGDSPGRNTGMGCYALLQGIFPTQGLNPGLPHCRQILHCLSHQESLWILEWVAYPFSRESSWPRNWTGAPCIGGVFFTSWATREAPLLWIWGCKWTWVWMDSGSWWWTGRPGVLWFMGWQRVGHDWAAELNWIFFWVSVFDFFKYIPRSGTSRSYGSSTVNFLKIPHVVFQRDPLWLRW